MSSGVFDAPVTDVKGGLRHVPVLSAVDCGIVRSPGPGFGNLMFPISRALIGQQRYGGEFVYPTMRQVKVGSFLRRERDKRTYGDVLRRRTLRDWRTWLSVAGGPNVDEHAFDGRRQGVNVRYAGLGNLFHDLTGHRDLIRQWMLSNQRFAQACEPFDIGIHVRLGDFCEAGQSRSGNNVRQPLEWYRAALEEARHLSGKAKPSVRLFTDGDPVEVSEKLRVGALGIDHGQNALQSILNLSRARVLVTSRSTFSMWAAFLGDMPAIWDRRYEARTRSFPDRAGLDHVV